MAAVVVVDQGTTSIRASVVAAGDLSRLGTSAESVPRAFPQPGWVETDAEEVVRATERAVARAVAASGLGPGELAGFGLANQGETVVVWERATGRPVGPAIGWQCRRTEARCEALRGDAGAAAAIRRTTGLPIDAYFSATKIAWILDALGLRGRAARGELVAGTLDAFTLHRLSGGKLFATDPSTACRTLLARLDTGRFDPELCAHFEVPAAMLPEVVSSDAALGSIRAAGLSLPVRALLCDQPAALLGTGSGAPGEGKCTYGTGAFVQVMTGSSPPAEPAGGHDGLLRSVAWELGGARNYLVEGSVLAAADVLSWLRDEVGLLDHHDELDAALEAFPGGAEVFFLPALTGLGAPHWVGSARGAVLGLHRGARREELLVAAMEGIAHQVADVLEAASPLVPGGLSELWADGGLANSSAFLRLQADVAGLTLKLAPGGEATTRGLAALCLAGAGLAESPLAAAAQLPAALIAPRSDKASRARRRDRHRRALDLLTSEAALALFR